MPFKLDKLVTAVDPVKMYEYIAFGKKIISVKYNELDKFSQYVSFYENYNEFKKILQSLESDKSVNILNDNFLELNNWENRKKKVVNLIEGMS